MLGGLQKFISRYISGKFDTSCKDQNIIPFLKIKKDIWPKSIIENEQYIPTMEKYEKLDILYKEIVSFYDYLTTQNSEKKQKKKKKKKIWNWIVASNKKSMFMFINVF